MKLRSSAPTMELRTRIIHKTAVPTEVERSGKKDKRGETLKRKICDENVDDKVGEKGKFDRKVWDEKSGERLIGVGRRGNGKFMCWIRHPFKREQIWLGTFDTPEEASSAYIRKKSEFEAGKGFQREKAVPMECDDGEFSGDQFHNLSTREGEEAVDSPCQTHASLESSSNSYLSKEGEFEAHNLSTQEGEDAADSPCQTHANLESSSNASLSKEGEFESSKGVQSEEEVEKEYDDGEFSDNQSHSLHEGEDAWDSPCQTHAAFESSQEDIAPSPESTYEPLLLQMHKASKSTEVPLPSSNEQNNSSEPTHESSDSLHDLLPSPKQTNAASESTHEPLPLPDQTHKAFESTQDPLPSSNQQHKSSEPTHENSDSQNDLLPSPNQTHVSSESTHEPLPLPSQTHNASESNQDTFPSSKQPHKVAESTHQNSDSPHQTRTAANSSHKPMLSSMPTRDPLLSSNQPHKASGAPLENSYSSHQARAASNLSHKPTPSSVPRQIVSVKSRKYKGGGAMGFLIPNPTRSEDHPRPWVFFPVIDSYGFLLGKFSKIDDLSICSDWQ